MAASPLYESFIFWLFAAISVVPALCILAARDIVRQAFWLLFSLSGFAGLYLSLGADFLGFTQVIVYIGGILILFLFGVMLTQKGDLPIKESGDADEGSGGRLLMPGVAAGIFTTGILLFVIWTTPWKSSPRAVEATAETIGAKVMSTFILPFEAVSILLLVALVGATYLARRKGAQE